MVLIGIGAVWQAHFGYLYLGREKQNVACI